MRIFSILSGTCAVALLAAVGMAHAASLSNADKQFMTRAAKTDMTEAHEGQMAESQATRADVREFAKTLAQDHTESYNHLAKIAARDGVSIPNGIDAGKDPAIKQLTHMKGASFDRQFARDEIAAHRHALAAYKHESAHGQDAEVKAYATKMIPVLEKHLHLAEECAQPSRRS
jgi:putative membrane protein